MTQVELPELDVIQQIAEIISPLTLSERRRVSAWLAEYVASEGVFVASEPAVGVVAVAAETASSVNQGAAGDEPISAGTQGSVPEKSFSTFAELYESIAPRKGVHKAAVAGWWLENEQGQQSWKVSEVNKLLESIGVKVSSMSIVLTNAVKVKSPLVIELARLGDGERSRKTFCLSEAGIAYVEGALA